MAYRYGRGLNNHVTKTSVISFRGGAWPQTKYLIVPYCVVHPNFILPLILVEEKWLKSLIPRRSKGRWHVFVLGRRKGTKGHFWVKNVFFFKVSVDTIFLGIFYYGKCGNEA